MSHWTSCLPATQCSLSLLATILTAYSLPRNGASAPPHFFKRAWQSRDLNALITLHPIHGATEIARFIVEVSQHLREAATLVERLVNGRPGLMVRIGGETTAVYAFDIAEGRITRIWAVRNPVKLRVWAEG